jgi:hypothetical protein
MGLKMDKEDINPVGDKLTATIKQPMMKCLVITLSFGELRIENIKDLEQNE